MSVYDLNNTLKAERNKIYECPHCHSDNYDCYESGPNDDYYYEMYTCMDCGCEFEIWYELKYVRTDFVTPAEKKEQDERTREFYREQYKRINKTFKEDALKALDKVSHLINNSVCEAMIKEIEDDNPGGCYDSRGLFSMSSFKIRLIKKQKEAKEDSDISELSRILATVN